MPRQELFLEQNIGDKHIEVIKTYDRSYAREVFRSMDDQATSALAAALDISENYEPADIPDQHSSEYEDFLWEELCTAAREDVRLDPNLYSFFVVSETTSGKTQDVYVSADWPSAEEFVQRSLRMPR